MSDTWDVEVWIYDLTGGMAGMMSQSLLGFHLEAIYHTAIIYNGMEYYFGGGNVGSGVTSCPPGTTQLGQPMRKVLLGKTEIDPETFKQWLGEMGHS
jgi:hypothetical protein